jgi:hypothetical protein
MKVKLFYFINLSHCNSVLVQNEKFNEKENTKHDKLQDDKETDGATRTAGTKDSRLQFGFTCVGDFQYA